MCNKIGKGSTLSCRSYFWRGGHQSFMCLGGGGALTPLFWLLVTFVLNFKSRVDPLTCVLFCLISMDSSDSSLVQDLLTSSWPAWKPSPFYPLAFQSLVEANEFYPLAFQSLVEANECCTSKAGDNYYRLT